MVPGVSLRLPPLRRSAARTTRCTRARDRTANAHSIQVSQR
jgi:hypothetical protein